MKKAMVFTLIFLLTFALCLVQTREVNTQEETPKEIVIETTRRFTERTSPRSDDRHWSRTFTFIGQVIEAKARWVDNGGFVGTIIKSGNTVRVSGFLRAQPFWSSYLHVTLTIKHTLALDRMDVNSDGATNIEDLMVIASHFGESGAQVADVNGDSIVNILDLVLVAGALGDDAAAAPSVHVESLGELSASEVQRWLTQAQRLGATDVPSQRGIAVLKHLLATLPSPKKTVLLTNYPNPFNPETWIPYYLAEPADVTLSIYSVDGRLVRTLALGHQAAGIYESKSRAVYWDGRNSVGERVASGLYFYTLTAGDFAATGKMLIMK